MSGYAKRTDDNQKEVVAELRAALPEASVHITSGTGDGFPDLVVGWKKRHNFLIELKDRDKPRGDRQLTNAQMAMHGNWQGQVAVCHSASEILATMLREVAP
jgi:hypothetical protein